MKKTFYLLAILCVLTLILSACSKDNKDKMQGTWKAGNITTEEFIDGESMTIKNNKITINKPNKDTSKSVLFKYFNFKDEEQENIRLYSDDNNSKYFDKKMPDEEGTIEIKDDNLYIKDSTGYKYKFSKQ